MIGVLLQVRLGSTRLPRKALLPLAGKPAVEHAMIALKAVRADRFALITDPGSRAELAESAKRCGYELFVGHETNVLHRYVHAARRFGLSTVVRATGDNPLVSGPLAQSAIEIHHRKRAELSGYDLLPVGTGVEVVEQGALETALSESEDPYEQEHVTQFLYRRPKRFRLNRVPAPLAFRSPGIRVTLDTAPDYRLLKQLFLDCYEGSPIQIATVIEWFLHADVPSALGQSV